MGNFNCRQGVILIVVAQASGTGNIIALSPIIENDEIRIHHDTLGIPPASYLLDIRITIPDSSDQWSEKLTIVLTKGISPPSPR